MESEEMVSVLKRTNKELNNSVSEQLLAEVLALAIKNPLDSDRGKCQERLKELINRRCGGE